MKAERVKTDVLTGIAATFERPCIKGTQHFAGLHSFY